ncbi:roadblock/LC7 domain-containing protein [Pseudolysobacter antarcticus]|uniref:Roadblock/LC7 domain-containing protein n=1 Tax=Pseudolysobacter antarcticus TaxID=2511995 RepID=A0A411HPK1_9GAMM|nr:roadblock/LC7 domain-containing protein [Pseudolysobacter antarcticus]QBB72413.1 roadblock/LC7 domain-containing protein [Pseudolysobacter antarcticus]
MTVPADLLGRTETAICQKLIDALLQTHTDISGALVSSIDGFEVAANLPGKISAARLAAMTSSLLALGEAVGNESAVGACRDIVIDASGGRVLLMDIPHPTRKLLLTVLCNTRVTLGQVLWAARNCRQEIGQRLGN